MFNITLLLCPVIFPNVKYFIIWTFIDFKTAPFSVQIVLLSLPLEY